ncbi:MAG: ABC transporter permease [Acidobacteria bacterium]|nr:ABC transporter permease [Acidobacteriota bacterium]
MYWRLIREPFRRPHTRRRALWAVAAMALGTAVSAAMLNVSIEIGDRMGEEVRALGPNIVITSAGDSLPVAIGGMEYRPISEESSLAEGSLPKLKSIFWRNNIKSFAPFLAVPTKLHTFTELPKLTTLATDKSSKLSESAVSATLTGTWFDFPMIKNEDESFRTGIRALNPAWFVQGEWATDTTQPPDSGQPIPAMLGERLARQLKTQPGDLIAADFAPADGQAFAPSVFRITGILSTGTAEDDQIFAPLAAVQKISGRLGQVETIRVSALIKPEDPLSRRDPESMSPADYDRWFCAPYLSSIMYQIGGAIPGSVVRPIREVAETQGSILSKMTFLMVLLALLALLAAAMGISSLASLSVIERRQEIALMKAIGATDGLVSTFLMTEMALQGLAGGVLGFCGGQLLASAVGRAVFETDVAVHWLLLPVIVAGAVILSLAGTWLPVLRAVRQQPAPVLRGE